MSAALERVIAEQQAEIDKLKAQQASAHETLNTLWERHDQLFDCFARLIDADIPDGANLDVAKAYRNLRHECRLKMLDAGYCMTCHNFVCECEGQYD